MNTAELLEQFIQESREGLELIGKRLLDVERDPADAALMNDLFRLVHTLKGNCGLFEFKALERLVHAGEDVLDKVRHGALVYQVDIADALLEAMDYTTELVDSIAQHGALPPAADARAQVLASALRRHIDIATPAAAAAPLTEAIVQPAVAAVEPAPDWAARVPEAWHGTGHLALRYQPEPECFFKGEDPWHLVLSVPGLQHLEVGTQAPWAPADQFDCYRCNLDLVVVSDAPRDQLEQHFRYVPDQLSWWHLQAAPVAHDEPAPASAVLLRRVCELWDEQARLLAVPDLADEAVAAARVVLRHLLECALGAEPSGQHAAWVTGRTVSDALAALDALPGGAAALSAWAHQHGPQVAQGQGVTPGAASAASSAPIDPARALPSAVAAGPLRPSPTRTDEGAAPRQVKVAQEKIDRLMALIGEMVVAKNALPYLAERAESHYKQRELAREIKAQYAVINRIAEDMQHGIMQVRMLPVGAVFQRFGRLVRDISHKLGKDVRLVVEGEETEADKNIIEALADPLIHILRNSLDHGLELPQVRVAAGKPAQGTLHVVARQEADRVTLNISDDGAGVDTDRVRAKAVERGLITAERAASLSEHEAVQLIFLAGFSTAETISDLSGRGVGMDVVRSAVERVNGSVTLTSERGRGTRIVLSLPLSMAVTNVMMIEASGSRLGVPMDLVVETVRVAAEDIHHFKRAKTAVLRGRIVPLRPLAELLALDAPPRCNDNGEHAVLVVRHGDENVGLIVDEFQGTSDIILKPLEGVLAGVVGFAGTALMGDGSVLMVLNPKELL